MEQELLIFPWLWRIPNRFPKGKLFQQPIKAASAKAMGLRTAFNTANITDRQNMMNLRHNGVAMAILALALAPVQTRAQTVYTPYTFTTLAGLAGNAGSSDGTGSVAQFVGPHDVALDKAGNLYIADQNNYTIRKITPAGAVTTIAGLARNYGTNDGTGSAARFVGPNCLAMDGAGNLFVTGQDHVIRKISPVGTNWVVTTIAGQSQVHGTNDGVGSAAQFYVPFGVAADTNGNVFVADTYNCTIRKLTQTGTNWLVTTIAGQSTFGEGGWAIGSSADGTGSDARFNYPYGLVLDDSGNIYVTDGNHTIRKMTPAGTNWMVTTVAGQSGIHGTNDGTGTNAQFYYPGGVAMDKAGNLFVTDGSNYTIRKMTPSGTNWVVTTLAGLPGSAGSTDGTGSAALFLVPCGIAVDGVGNVYVTDYEYHTIRRGFVADGAPALVSSGPDFGFNAGVFGFNISGPAGQSVLVQGSTDLANWLPISTNTIGTGAWKFTDPQSATNSSRFYRAVKQ
ncbi:MAG: repeat containing protein [Pedosphaera sp.]|nr:repeat containing protein [Pedosphaera sp.]